MTTQAEKPSLHPPSTRSQQIDGHSEDESRHGLPNGFQSNEQSLGLIGQRYESTGDIKSHPFMRHFWPTVRNNIEDDRLQANMLGCYHRAFHSIRQQNFAKAQPLMARIDRDHR